ncbi:MAG: radical SAM family heme chaperone HemW [Bacteroidales bacterium]|jgi:oxygen-independent coproporphyrinogen-3 oxidase|nr:radical SAM family heme chaperone HemW [Bacteroidales bacterium]
MAGIYIHIPFCRQKCYYCDFYKTVNTSLIGNFIKALLKELELRKDYIDGEKIETVYFGGGTPSILKKDELRQIIYFLNNTFDIASDAEITLEANPDDLLPDCIEMLLNSGINRLSIGVQSFQNEHLKRMNRRHNVQQAIQSVENAAKIGFKNISLDLIYGLPELTPNQWNETLHQVFALSFQHLSAYHLTYHQGTPFYTWLKKGKINEICETESVEQFNILIDIAEMYGFEQYEISNFAKNKMYSKHNSSYWSGVKYIGAGPSAHSFNGDERQWNISNLKNYINAVENGLSYFETEQLSKNEKFNEFVLVHLRTKWGISISETGRKFGKENANIVEKELQKYQKYGFVKYNGNYYALTREGMFISDEILSNLMIV